MQAVHWQPVTVFVSKFLSLGAVNPFESFDNQEAVERDIVNSIDFGLNDNEEFLSSGE